MAERETRRQRQERIREEARLRREQTRGRQRWQRGFVAVGAAFVMAVSGGYGIYQFLQTQQQEVTDDAFSPGGETPSLAGEKLSDIEKNIITDEILKISNYSEPKLAEIENLIKAGSSETQMFELENQDKIYVRFSKLGQTTGTDLSGTDVTLTFTQKPQGRVAEIHFRSSIGERIVRDFPQPVRDNLVRREATAAYMQMIAIARLFGLKGVDLSQPIDPQMSKAGLNDKKIESLMEDFLAVIEPYSISVPQLAEAFGLLSIVDRTATGTIRFLPIPALGNTVFHTTIGGVFYPDNGKFYLGLNLLGATISQTSSMTDLQRNYSSIKDIPGWPIYHSQLNGYYRTNNPIRDGI